MGNVLLDQYKKGDPAQNFERWLETNPDLINKTLLCQNKFFRTCSFTHRNRKIIIKVFFRRQPSVVKQYLKGFQLIQDMVQKLNCCHLMPLRVVDHKEASKLNQNFIGAARQYIQNTLQNRIIGRPRLTIQSKRWMIFQMILAVYTLHMDFNLYHGNIRTSNFLLTNYQQLILTDFGIYKPLYILQQTQRGLAQFRFFYGSSINKCTLAPQKMAGNKSMNDNERTPCKLLSIYNANRIDKEITQQKIRYSVIAPKKQNQQTQSAVNQSYDLSLYEYNQKIKDFKMMDMFSLGCSILEVLNDGKPVFSYESLLSWKKNQFQIKQLISNSTENLPNGQKIKNLVTQLIKLRPTSRMEIETLLQQWLKIVNQDVYLLLWHVISCFSTTSFHLPDFRICLFQEIFKYIQKQIKKTNYEFKMALPHSLKQFHALKIFVNIMKNKIIPTIIPSDNLIISKIINHVDHSQHEKQTEQNFEQALGRDSNQRQSFFINNTLQLRTKRSSLFKPTNSNHNNLCPPEWNQSLMALVDQKYKGVRLTPEQETKNRFQDNLKRIMKSQNYRKQRIEERRDYYEQYQLAIKIIFSCIRGCKYVSSKLVGIQLLMLLCNQSTDACKLRILIPYLIQMAGDNDIAVASFSFHCLIDIFYRFIDPFENQEDTAYYFLFTQTLANMVQGTRLRSSVFSRMKQIFNICEWLQIHCLKLVKNYKRASFNMIIEVIKQKYPSFSPSQTQLFMSNLPEVLIPQFFQFFISFINSQTLLGLQKSVKIAEFTENDIHKKMINILDSCVENSLDESGLSLRYAIQYFTIRKITHKSIVKRIAPLIIHPNLWIHKQVLAYVHMCLREYPPTQIFFIFRQIFQPPFPLQEKDIGDQILLPKILTDSEVDYKQKIIHDSIDRKIGLTQKLFVHYLKRSVPAKSFPVATQKQIQQWNLKARTLQDIIISANGSKQVQPTDFSLEIRNAIVDLHEMNFLYYVGLIEKKFKVNDKQKQKQKNMTELQDSCRIFNKFYLNDRKITLQKKLYFDSLRTILNTNFEKLLKRFNKEYVNDKLKISNGVYLINSIIDKFQQFQLRPQLKLGSYVHKPTEYQKIPKPKGTQVTQIYEHKDIITCLQKIANTFFISGSSDGTIRIFNSKKIETNIIADSDAYYQMKADNSNQLVKVSSIAAFDSTYSIAVGTNKGQIKILKIERMPGMSQLPKNSKAENDAQIYKYNVGGQIEKVATFNNQLKNECFCYVTAEGILGIQDMRMKTKTIIQSIGRQRGIPKSLAVSRTDYSIMVGTVDGYLLTYDVRCNIISNVLQMYCDNTPTAITNIQSVPLKESQSYPMYAIAYPSKFYEFSYFNLQNDKQQFHPEKLFTSAMPNQIISVPYFVNKTKQENFKLCNNTLTHKIYYSNLSDFHRNFNILEYLSDPLTIRQNKIREVWMDNCKHRYNQICSLYDKKVIPFVEYLQSGILTNLNPCISNQGANIERNSSAIGSTQNKKSPFTLLSEPTKRQSIRESLRQSYKENHDSIDRVLVQRPNNFKTYAFPDQQSSQYFTCCKVLPNFVVVGCRNSVIKVYK